MSTASKITLGSSIFLCVATTVGVYYLSEFERDALKEGPIRDQERINRRKDLNMKQQANLDDFEAQKRLKEQLASEQPLTGKIIDGIDKK